MSRDTNFYYSFLVLPPRKRRAIVAVWDFCRAVDDAVDEVVPEEEWQGGLTEEARGRATRQLCGWRAELEKVFGGQPETDQGRALQPFAAEFSLPRAEFEGLIDGVQMDLDHPTYPTFTALEENETVISLVYDTSGMTFDDVAGTYVGDLKVRDNTTRVLVAFVTKSGGTERRLVSKNYATIAATSTISSTVAPRDRSDIGRANPCSTGPSATAPPSRCTNL